MNGKTERTKHPGYLLLVSSGHEMDGAHKRSYLYGGLSKTPINMLTGIRWISYGSTPGSTNIGN